MKALHRLVLAVLFIGAPAAAQDGPLRLLGVAPLSPDGNEWRNGVELALREINARGGMLGRQVIVRYSDTQTGTPDLILSAGPLPAGDAPRLISQATPLVAYAAALNLRHVVLLTLGDECPDLRGLRITTIVIEPEQIDFSATVIRARSADALIVRLPQAETARLVRELRRQRYDKPVIGDARLLQIGETAQGLRLLIGLEAEAPVPAIRHTARKYQQAYRAPASAQALRGYAIVYAAKAALAKTGRLDRSAFRNQRLETANQPGLLLDAEIDADGVLTHRPLLVD